ncbi:TAXI family TRAP transporter solute-binding subunit [Desulfomonile tiedjei]|uniref:TRAP transporter solute receptor, TAXI family n=1 Tax=Desulfomonile tiedjei (strain ATCC 49306 / DSM 6799 / DCB-1) TaxID=706587 RepID=I4C1V5_DESTA|nr:TAXI family TRAP transporter solute-binding subunit [Desulfomonile tiedjei]AFM23546.1 TRAP transporter solute receptor, TAXI family [Desulfomonile tiedjei DSM 6799]
MEHGSQVKGGCKTGRRDFLTLMTGLGCGMIVGHPAGLWAQTTRRISIATGGMGGVYFPMGGAIAAVISKHLPNVEATAEVTAASVDNCKLVEAKQSDLGIVMGDVAYDAFAGTGKFKKKLSLRNIAVLYPGLLHVVTLEGKGIKNIADMKGKTISSGAPGSGTEIMALRILEVNGINPEKDVRRDRLGASESAGALKDGKIDAYFWTGGVPTASVLDLACSPGVKMCVIQHGDCIEKVTSKYGPVYYSATIPKGIYSGVTEDVPVAAVGNILVVRQDMDEKLVYDILTTMFDRKDELAAVHKEAEGFSVKNAATGSPIPYHKGAQKYYKEKGIEVMA